MVHGTFRERVEMVVFDPYGEVLGGILELSGQLPLEKDLQRMIAASLNLDVDMAEVVSYDTVQSSFGRRQSDAPIALQFKAFTTKAHAASTTAGTLGILADLDVMLAQAVGNQTELLGLSVQITRTRQPGEVWQEENRVFVIKACPKGHLLVNASMDEQMCWSRFCIHFNLLPRIAALCAFPFPISFPSHLSLHCIHTFSHDGALI